MQEANIEAVNFDTTTRTMTGLVGKVLMGEREMLEMPSQMGER